MEFLSSVRRLEVAWDGLEASLTEIGAAVHTACDSLSKILYRDEKGINV